jgi:MerR family transcriptional regulator, heat shock protein HspR
MTTDVDLPHCALQRFSVDPEARYHIDVVAHLTRLPRHLILVCYKNGLVAAEADPDYGGYYFDQDAIRILQRVEYLHQQCGINMAGLRTIFGLMDEVERLRATLAARD